MLKTTDETQKIKNVNLPPRSLKSKIDNFSSWLGIFLMGCVLQYYTASISISFLGFFVSFMGFLGISKHFSIYVKKPHFNFWDKIKNYSQKHKFLSFCFIFGSVTLDPIFFFSLTAISLIIDKICHHPLKNIEQFLFNVINHIQQITFSTFKNYLNQHPGKSASLFLGAIFGLILHLYSFTFQLGLFATFNELLLITLPDSFLAATLQMSGLILNFAFIVSAPFILISLLSFGSLMLWEKITLTPTPEPTPTPNKKIELEKKQDAPNATKEPVNNTGSEKSLTIAYTRAPTKPTCANDSQPHEKATTLSMKKKRLV